MGFWIYMLAVDLLIPLSMLFLGRRFQACAPKNINLLFGYRTAMSTKNQDTWQFAHRIFGRLWWRWGWVTLAATLLGMLLVLGKPVGTVGAVGGWLCAAQLVPMLGVILPVERALRRTFDKDGNRKN